MEETFKVITPVDGSIYLERPYATQDQIEATVLRARLATREWRATAISDRQEIVNRFLSAFTNHKAEIATEITWQMGRPVRYTPFEVDRMVDRTRHMLEVAPEALS